MGGMKISELDFVRLLPVFMRDDEAVIALCKAVDTLLGEPAKRVSTIRTWDKIDELNEAELDELAWELDIDWYDSTGMGLEEKRETIKLAQQIKRKRGTKWAVEQLITAYLGEGYVAEWFERDKDPFTFVALTPNTEITDEQLAKFREGVYAAKNARSHLAGILYYWKQGPEPGVEYILDTLRRVYGFTKCGTRDRAATVGMAVKYGMETEPEATAHRYSFPKTGATTCGSSGTGTGSQDAGLVGAALKVPVETEPETSHAVYTFPKCGENLPNAVHGVARVGTAIVGVSVVASE